MSYPFPVSADEFKGKRVLVTGGTKGMGALIVERFVVSGASVATAARSPLPADQRPALFIQADIGSPDGAGAIVERVNREWDGIDILINCVGGSEAPNGGFAALSDEDWSRALDVNLLAAVRIDRAFIPGMVARKSGAVIHINSIQHRLPLYDATLPYAAAKAGLNALTVAFAHAYGPKVRVNCIQAGPFLTDISKAWDMESATTRFRALLALKRPGQPEEIIGAALYFASDASSFTSGAVLRVDGGQM